MRKTVTISSMTEKEFTALKEEIAKKSSVEEKIRGAIDFMKEAISSSDSPRFKDFWNAKELALTLFKEKINPGLRAEFWKDYTSLIEEERRLKDVFDQEAAFAVEQVDIAIDAIGELLENKEEMIEKVQPVSFSKSAFHLNQNRKLYASHYRELKFLSGLGERLKALRKEVLGTEMRIRFKNKILQKLSKLGDQIFPRRRVLIDEISAQFVQDVKRFADKNFGSDATAKGFQLRDEIKAFQEFAKILTISSSSFQEVRKILSGCWDKIKESDKERKKEYEEKKGLFDENAVKIEELIAPLQEEYEKLPLEETNKRIDTILTQMRETELSFEAIKKFKDLLHGMRREKMAKIEEEAKKRRAIEKEKMEQRQEELNSLYADWSHFLESSPEKTMLAEAPQVWEEKLKSLQVVEHERDPFSILFDQLEDLNLMRKEAELIETAEIDEAYLEALENALANRIEFRDRVKMRLESLRKEAGGSSLDFERAIKAQEQVQREKARLTASNKAIAQLESRIDEITE